MDIPLYMSCEYFQHVNHLANVVLVTKKIIVHSMSPQQFHFTSIGSVSFYHQDLF